MGQAQQKGAADTEQQLEEKYFRQKVKLGEGSFGTVWRAVDRESGDLVAIKELPLAQLRRRNVTRADVLREVALLQFCRHRSVIALFGYFEGAKSLFLALEYCDGGDFGDKIRQLGMQISEADAAHFVGQMCEAVSALHMRMVCHRDIKPENFMVQGKGTLKLADFGLAVKLEQHGQLLQQACGTRAFLAPEQSPFSVRSRGYGLPVDVWALGVSMYMVMFGSKHPFVDKDGRLEESRVLKGSVDFRDLSRGINAFFGIHGPGGMGLRYGDRARGLCKRLLEPDPVRRLSAGAAAADPWLRDEWRSSSSSKASSSCSTASHAVSHASSERRDASASRKPPPLRRQSAPAAPPKSPRQLSDSASAAPCRCITAAPGILRI